MNVEFYILVANAVATCCLVGLIWTIQLVHYPAFVFVDAARFGEFEAFHQRRITWIVAPLMLVELVSGGALLILQPAFFPLWLAAAGMCFIGVIWLSTWLVLVPLHARLVVAFDSKTWTELVRTNWVRTWAWTARGVVIIIGLGHFA